MGNDDERITSFKDLRVWQASMKAAAEVLNACDEEPIAKKFRLAGQLEAASTSIPANIAEGHASGSTRNYLKHLYIARGSLAETLTFLELFGREKYIAGQRAGAIAESFKPVGKMLNALINSLEAKHEKGRKPRP